jgi:hypothetical protein
VSARAARRFALAALLASPIFACASTPSSPVSYDAVVVPRLAPSFEGQGGWTVEVREASVAFGPLYFCASEAGSATVCDTAQAEIARVARVDALAGPRSIGPVFGFTGAIRSASYDLGMTWLDTQSAVTPQPEAPGGHSLLVRGTARRDARSLPFELAVDVVPQFQGQRAVPSAEASADVGADVTRLEIGLDVQAWLGAIDWEEASREGGRLTEGGKTHASVLLGIKNVRPPEFRFVRGP